MECRGRTRADSSTVISDRIEDCGMESHELSSPSDTRHGFRPALDSLKSLLFCGICVQTSASDPTQAFVAVSFHDGHFNVDYCVHEIRGHTASKLAEKENEDEPNSTTATPATFVQADHADLSALISASTLQLRDMECSLGVNERLDQSIANHILTCLKRYADCHGCKVVGCGIDAASVGVLSSFGGRGCCPSVPRRLWLELDVVPFVFLVKGEPIDERSDSAARKCAEQFGADGLGRLTSNSHHLSYDPSLPRLRIGYRNQVLVDTDHQIPMVDLSDYQNTVSPRTWSILMALAREHRDRHLRVAYFNATPQGGGVALMRHALIRLCRLLDLRVDWFVPKPNPRVFRITKNNHNILQGVSDPSVQFTADDQRHYEEWVNSNCERHWMQANGPFVTSDIIVLDDPQMAGLIPHIKSVNSRAKIIYRSHIEIRADLADHMGTPQHRVWSFLRGLIDQADLFISHPIASFIPGDVDANKVLAMPACTDPLDGLNKPLASDAVDFYLQWFRQLCRKQMGGTFSYPARPYIIQIARFDPAKGMPDVLHVYKIFRKQAQFNERPVPQLVLCGHGSVDDPDATIIFDQAMHIIQSVDYDDIRADICMARLPPSDCLLNALLRCARVALQLSHREGFEVKVTEALHKGVPVIAYDAGGIPLQIISGKSGYLVPVGDVQAVVNHLVRLCLDDAHWTAMKDDAARLITEEYWTVWNCISWLWLFKRLRASDSLTTEGPLAPSQTFHWVKEEWNSYYAQI